MLADQADYVLGVDTHRDRHSAAVLFTATGVVEGQIEAVANESGYRQLLRFGTERAPGSRAWAIEGTGSYGAGLAAFLAAQGEWVIEVDRPRRAPRRNRPKSDALDAIKAAHEALSRKHQAAPRLRGEREALRVLLATREGAVNAKTQAVLLLKGLVVSAPEEVREPLRRLLTSEQLLRCSRLRTHPAHSHERRCTIIALRSAARRALALQREALELERELAALVRRVAPVLLTEFGVGPITAARVFSTWSHPGRFRSEAAFAALAGTAPIPASSGLVMRYRLNRAGDRQLNRALHTIVLCRMRDDPKTRAYAARRQAEGRSTREIKRCLKRYAARHLYRLLEATAPPSEIRSMTG
jgi:transposase